MGYLHHTTCVVWCSAPRTIPRGGHARMEELKTWQEKMSRIGLVVLVCLLLIMAYLSYHAGRFNGLNNVAALDYGQIARNLANGDGYTTKFIRPLSLARFPRLDHHPEVAAPPLHPFVASLFMRIMADKERAVALSGGLAFLLTVPVVFFLGWQLFDIRTGLLAGALFALNIGNLRASISGLETPWLTLWTALLLLICYNLSRKLRWRVPLAAAAGVVMGLAYLTQYIWLAVVPLFAVFILLASDRRTRWTATAAFILLFVLVITPWCIRTANVTGSPFACFRGVESIMGTRSNPGNTLYRQFTPQTTPWAAYLFQHPMEIIQKAASGLGNLYPTLMNMGGAYVTPFFLVAILVTLGSASFERLRVLGYASFAVLFIGSLFTSPLPRILIPLGVLVTVVAAGFFFRLMETRVGALMPARRARLMGLAVVTLCLIQGLPTLFDLLSGRTPDDTRSAQLVRSARDVGSLTSGAIITDVPWLIAWHCDRPAIWLPKTAADLQNMERKVGKIPWLMLTPQVADRNYDISERALKEWAPAWYEGANGDVDFQGYTVSRRVNPGPWVLYKANPAAKRDLPPEASAPFQDASPAGAPASR
jgi:4-amino-4-deoxy-L-arabinose transferase-like glycosyltransferase